MKIYTRKDHDDDDNDYLDNAPIGSVALVDMPAMIDALSACRAVSRTPPPAAPAEISTATRPVITNLVQIVTPEDYPAPAQRGRVAGTVRFRLAVAANGAVTGCGIISSTGSFELDLATCALLRRRARVTPAKDASGDNVPGTVNGTVGWAPW